MLKTDAIVHEHADVANAIGAVVGQVQQRVDIQITQPGEGQFSVTGIDKPFISEVEAISAARDLAQKTACQRAEDAGAQEIEVVVNLEEKRASIESRDMLIEALVTAIATGRPPIVGD